jgi:signal transduction histidine kinase
MEQLFHNLISNGLKFSKPGVPPFIQITTRELDKTKVVNTGLDPSLRYVEIVVSDKGIGFPGGQKEKIFELFHRLNSKEEYPGTGIGLALCRKIVDNHGGKIFAESTQTKGTEFHIIFPYVRLKPET